MKRLVISDIHIGSRYYKGELLIEFLKTQEYDELILAGDIIDFIRVPLFTKRALEIARAINFSKDIYYIVGNHDTPLSGFVGEEAFGLKFVKKYEFEENGRKFRIEHGDQYDQSMFIHNNIIMNFLSVSQDCIEFWFNINLSDIFTRWRIKKRKLRRIWDILKDNSDVDVYICGHSHTPEAIVWIQPDQAINTYVNTGDWVSHTSYVTIIDGEIRLREFISKDEEEANKPK
jgi:UDP-2,3-diacylglucosamine pyrophosphatase LpxH